MRALTPRSAAPAAGLLLLALTLATICAAAPVAARTWSETFTFDAPAWQPLVIDGAHYETPSLPGARTIGRAGEPLLPVYTARFLLPPGEALAEVRIVDRAAAAVSPHIPAPAQAERPLSRPGPVAPTAPDAAIYSADAFFPTAAFEVVTVQTYRGHRIAYVNLFPLRARPATGEVAFTPTLTVAVTTTPDPAVRAASERTYRSGRETAAWLARQVVNPELAAEYAATFARPTPAGGARTLVDPDDTYLYVIITSATYATAFAPLAADRTAKGLPATIVLIDDIYAEYGGVDAQEQVRNFILDAYQNWESEYVLFGGDIDVIPDRDCYCYVIDEGTPIETNDLCCELYYGGLDGTWNDDGDDRWGEPDEADLVPDIHIGRVCPDGVADVNAFVAKLLRYEREPVASEIESAAFFGEYLWEETWGGMYMEEIRLGADTWGYTTAGVPLDWATDTHYEQNGSWSAAIYINQMNSGTHMFHHLGHSNASYNAKVYTIDVPDFTADGVTHGHHFGYTQGCHAGEFDDSDCILEAFVNSPTGYVAFIGNTRYGFGVHYTTNGSSQYYHRQYVDALFAEDLNELAAANDDSRADNVGYIDYESNRWVHYEITAFGDPAMPVWTAAPRTPQLAHASVFVLGTASYDVTVSADGAPVAGARVALWDEAESCYGYGVTDASGEVTIAVAPDYPGTLHIVVSDADLLVTETTVPIVPDGPFIVVAERTLGDAAGGNGDGDGDAGETLTLEVALENVWDGAITGVSATLATESPYVELTDDVVPYGNFTGGEIKTGLGGETFSFTVAGDCPDQTALAFSLTIEDDQDHAWDAAFAYEIDAPALTLLYLALDDSAGGDGDGVFEPGESVTIGIDLGNDGQAAAVALAAELVSHNADLTITQPSASGGTIPAGGSGSLVPLFAASLAADAPSPALLAATLALSGDWSLTVDLPLELTVGGLRDDMEAGEGGWTHAVVDPGFSDQWHRSSERNHTPAGSYAWKFGAEGGGYTSLADGALVTPPIDVLTHIELTFWHWINAEVSGSYPGYCYDGGRVEVAFDGGPWQAIEPEGGYPYLIRAGGTPGPFPAETPVFSGAHDWQAETFLLDAGGSTVQFRFRFGSDGAVAAEGWYIDDVVISSWPESSPVSDPALVVSAPRLTGNHPNPFGPETQIRFALADESAVQLTVFDASGRVVRELVAGERLAAGTHTVVWNGRDQLDQPVGTGVYFCRFQAAGKSATRKMTLLR